MASFLPDSVAIRVLSLVLMSALAGPAFASEIQGTVSDRESGEVLPLAGVEIKGSSFSGGTVCDARGHYVLREIPAGDYTITIRYIGYFDQSTQIKTVGDSTYLLDAALIPDVLEIEEVIVRADAVSGEKETQPGIMSFSTDELMQAPGIAEPDPIRVLPLLPGVQSASDLSSGLYIRGGGPDQTLVLLDEVTLYNPTHAFGFFSTFNADAIDHVTLYKGAYPAEYGGRLGAVLDVRNREGVRSGFEGNGGISTISGRMLLEGPFQNGSWLVSLRRTYLEPILSSIRNEDNQIPAYYFYDLNGKLAWNTQTGDRVEVSGYAGRDVLDFDLDEDSYIGIRWGNRTFSSKYTHLYNSSLAGAFGFSASEYESLTDATIFTTPLSYTNELRDYSIRADLTWEAHAKHTITTGILATSYRFRFHQEFNNEEQLEYDESPADVSYYIEDDWRPARGTQMKSGVRFRYFSEGSRLLVEPRLSASTQLAPGFRVKVGGGLYNQYLQLVSTEGFSAGDFYIPIDESTEPGKSWQAVMGVIWLPSRKYELSIETYYTGLDNLVLFDNNVSADQASVDAEDIFITGGEGFATGVELFAQKRTGRLTGWIGYTLAWTRRRFDELNRGESFPPKYDRRNDLSVVASWGQGKWKYGGAFVFGTGQAFTPASARYSIRNPATGEYSGSGEVLPAARNSARLLPYHRLDVSVGRQFTLFDWEAEWVFQVFNLYSRRNEWFVQFDTGNIENEPEVVKMLPLIPSLGVNFAF